MAPSGDRSPRREFQRAGTFGTVADTGAFLLVALPAGVLVDRVRRRRLMLGCDVALLIVVGTVPAAQVAGVLSLAQLCVVALISSVLSVLSTVRA